MPQALQQRGLLTALRPDDTDDHLAGFVIGISETCAGLSKRQPESPGADHMVISTSQHRVGGLRTKCMTWEKTP